MHDIHAARDHRLVSGITSFARVELCRSRMLSCFSAKIMQCCCAPACTPHTCVWFQALSYARHVCTMFSRICPARNPEVSVRTNVRANAYECRPTKMRRVVGENSMHARMHAHLRAQCTDCLERSSTLAEIFISIHLQIPQLNRFRIHKNTSE